MSNPMVMLYDAAAGSGGGGAAGGGPVVTSWVSQVPVDHGWWAGNPMMWIAAGLAVYALERTCWAMDEASRRGSRGLDALAAFLFFFAVVALILSFVAWKIAH